MRNRTMDSTRAMSMSKVQKKSNIDSTPKYIYLYILKNTCIHTHILHLYTCIRNGSSVEELLPKCAPPFIQSFCARERREVKAFVWHAHWFSSLRFSVMFYLFFNFSTCYFCCPLAMRISAKCIILLYICNISECVHARTFEMFTNLLNCVIILFVRGGVTIYIYEYVFVFTLIYYFCVYIHFEGVVQKQKKKIFK